MTVSAPYYGENTVMRTPPPDLPSLLLKERIVYLGLPLFSDDDADFTKDAFSAAPVGCGMSRNCFLQVS